MTPYFNSEIKPTENLLDLKMTERMYILLNTHKNLYASLFDFTVPWKIDIIKFMQQNYNKDLSLAEMATTLEEALLPLSGTLGKLATSPPPPSPPRTPRVTSAFCPLLFPCFPLLFLPKHYPKPVKRSSGVLLVFFYPGTNFLKRWKQKKACTKKSASLLIWSILTVMPYIL